ncbi:MAG: right-handed parallel beta-helix repeat-containing protein, partial [Bacteroidota bacterium]
MQAIVWLLLLCSFPLTTFAQTRYGMQVNEPSTYAQTYHVKMSGNDNNDGSSSRPFRTLGKALNTAKNQSLTQGNKTKIKIYSGTYTESIFMKDWGAGENIFLAIEGQTAGGPVRLQPSTSSNPWALRIEGKSKLLLRKIHFQKGKSSPGKSFAGAVFKTYWGFDITPSKRPTNWLIEQCHFYNGAARGAEIYHVDYITIKDCHFYNNGSDGLHFAGRNAILENLEIYNNGKVHNKHGLLYMGAFNVKANRLNIHDNEDIGFRMDHACRNLTIEDSQFKKNRFGLMFETCEGPVTIKNSEIAQNEVGSMLSTVHDITYEGVTFKDNTRSVFQIYVRDRTDPSTCRPEDAWTCLAGDYNQSGNWTNNIPIAWNENMVVKNSTFIGKGTALFFERIFGDNAQFGRWLREEYTGANNTFSHTNRSDVFETSNDIYGRPRVYDDFAAWQEKTGSEKNSIWQGTSTTFPHPNQWYTIQHATTGRYINTDPNSVVKTSSSCCAEDFSWRFVSAGNGDWYIVNKINGRGALDSDLANQFVVWSPSETGGDDKKWRIEEVNGKYRFKNKNSTRGYLYSGGSGEAYHLKWNNGETWQSTEWSVKTANSNNSRLALDTPLKEVEEGQVPQSLVLFPNPNEGKFMLKGITKAAVKIINLQGKVQWQKEAVEADEEIDIQALQAGTYLVSITGEDGN